MANYGHFFLHINMIFQKKYVFGRFSVLKCGGLTPAGGLRATRKSVPNPAKAVLRPLASGPRTALGLLRAALGAICELLTSCPSRSPDQN